MATVYKEASAAIGTSGGQTKGKRILVSGSHATNIGTAELKTGGAAGTTVWKVFMGPGEAHQFELPANIVFDYLTIADVVVTLEYYKPHGITSSI